MRGRLRARAVVAAVAGLGVAATVLALPAAQSVSAELSSLAGQWTPAAGQEWDDPTGRLDPAAFAQPPSTSRPHAFWFWNGELTEAELDRQLDEMRQGGVEEFFIHPRQGLGGEFGVSENDYYLSTDWFDKVGFVLERARELGMKAWLYDDLNWPSGFAGGRTVRGGEVDGRTVEANPEFVPWYLTPIAVDVSGPRVYDEPVPVGDPEGPLTEALVAAVALPKAVDGTCVTGGQARGVALDGSRRLDLTDQVAGGRLRWDVPDGEWCLLHLVQRPLLGYHPDLEPDEPFVDMLNPAVTQKFIDITHETYWGRFENHFGTTIPGIFNDEPGFYNNFPDGRGGADSRGSVPWTPGFAGYLAEHSGTDLAGRLAALWYDVGDTTTSTKVAYYEALTDRYNEAHTKPLADWADEHGIALISNLLVEEDLGSHRLIQGGSWFEVSRHYQLPGMDLIGGLNTSAITPKLNSSVAHLFDRPRNLAETFGAFGWDLTMEEMKRTVAWEAAGGVDLIDNHAFYYSTEGGRAFESAPSQFFQNSFWPRFDRYAELVGRLSEPARGSTPVNPVAVLYPSTSMLATGTPWDVRGFAGNGAALGPVDVSWKGTSNDLLAAQLDFDYVDEYALAGEDQLGIEVRVDGDDLALHDQRWQALVLPRTTVITLEAVETMQRLADAGGTVVAVEGLPTHEAKGRDAELRERLEQLFGGLDGDGAARRSHGDGGLAAFLPSRAELADLLRERVDAGVTFQPASADVRVRHVKRRSDDAFLVVNLAGREVSTEAVFDVAQTPELWDPETGDTAVAPVFRHEGRQTAVALDLEPYEAVWVVFRPGAHPAGSTPHLTAANADVIDVEPAGDTLDVRLLADEPGEVYAAGEYRGRSYGALTTVDDPLTPIELDGDWTFRFDRAGAEPVSRPLGSWTDLDPRYTGAGTYTTTVDVPADFLAGDRRVVLDLGTVRDLAAVSVNGSPPLHRDWSPYTVDVTDLLTAGANEIAVTVTNTPANAVEGNSRASGLLGPVALRPRQVVDLALVPGAEVTSVAMDVTPAAATTVAGQAVELTATVSGIAPGRLDGTLSAAVPAGWTATPAEQPVTLDSQGRPVRAAAAVTVTPPDDAAEGEYPVTLTLDIGDHVITEEMTVTIASVVAAWEFDTDGDAEGWTAANQVTPLTVTAGELRFSSTGGDPFIVGPPMDAPIGDGLTVDVTMTSSVAGGGQLFWATSDGGFAESRSGRFDVSPGRHTYRVPIPASVERLQRLRLDPVSGTGDFAVDAIRVLP